MKIKVIIAAALFIFACFTSIRPASAALACSASATPIAFGTITTRDGGADVTTGTVTISCSSGTPNTSMSACLSLGAGSGGAGAGMSPRYMRRADNVALDYELRNGGYSSPTWENESFIQLLDGDGAASFPMTIFAVVTATGSEVRGGSYASLFTGTDVSFSYGEGACATQGAGVTFTVSADVAPSCTLAVTPMAFGSLDSLATAVDQEATVSINCTNATTYAVKLGLGNGTGVTDPAVRKLTRNSNTITYGIYQDQARNVPWGEAPTNDVDGTGAGSPQTITAYGRIHPHQTTPPAGSYVDTIVVTIEY